MATEISFGSPECFVVISRHTVVFEGEGEPGLLYRETFDQPEFNPRWEHGTADHTEIVSF